MTSPRNSANFSVDVATVATREALTTHASPEESCVASVTPASLTMDCQRSSMKSMFVNAGAATTKTKTKTGNVCNRTT